MLCVHSECPTCTCKRLVVLPHVDPYAGPVPLRNDEELVGLRGSCLQYNEGGKVTRHVIYLRPGESVIDVGPSNTRYMGRVRRTEGEGMMFGVGTINPPIHRWIVRKKEPCT